MVAALLELHSLENRKYKKYCSFGVLFWDSEQIYFDFETKMYLELEKALLWTLTFIFYWADFGTSQDKH